MLSDSPLFSKTLLIKSEEINIGIVLSFISFFSSKKLFQLFKSFKSFNLNSIKEPLLSSLISTGV